MSATPHPPSSRGHPLKGIGRCGSRRWQPAPARVAAPVRRGPCSTLPRPRLMGANAVLLDPGPQIPGARPHRRRAQGADGTSGFNRHALPRFLPCAARHRLELDNETQPARTGRRSVALCAAHSRLLTFIDCYSELPKISSPDRADLGKYPFSPLMSVSVRAKR
jgi:hypothetical protein